MNKAHMLDLASAYGFQKTLERPEEHKIRLQGEHTFMDVWDGRRGIVVGIYWPKNRALSYHRRLTLGTFEDLLIRLNKET